MAGSDRSDNGKRRGLEKVQISLTIKQVHTFTSGFIFRIFKDLTMSALDRRIVNMELRSLLKLY